MSPENVGPTAGATAMTIDTRPMVRPRRAAGTSVMIVVISSGSISAVPEAWMTRATSSTPKAGAMPASSVPAANSDVAVRKTARVVNRWRISPLVGMTTAIVRR